jgi:hypothetical protein
MTLMADTPDNFKPFRRAKGAQALADLVPDLLDPVLQRRAGLTTALVAAWPEIAGPDYAGRTVPLRSVWSRADSALDGGGPAILVVAADPAVALMVQHETEALLARVNAFFGYRAIDRIKVERKAVAVRKSRTVRAEPGPVERFKADALVAGVDDEGLRMALARLGANVMAAKRHSAT